MAALAAHRSGRESPKRPNKSHAARVSPRPLSSNMPLAAGKAGIPMRSSSETSHGSMGLQTPTTAALNWPRA